MFTRTLTNVILTVGLAAGGLGLTSVAGSAHPPGPRECWAWHHHHWVWVCPRPYSPMHPEIGFYLGFNDSGHRIHHKDWDGKKHDNGYMGDNDKYQKNGPPKHKDWDDRDRTEN